MESYKSPWSVARFLEDVAVRVQPLNTGDNESTGNTSSFAAYLPSETHSTETNETAVGATEESKPVGILDLPYELREPIYRFIGDDIAKSQPKKDFFAPLVTHSFRKTTRTIALNTTLLRRIRPLLQCHPLIAAEFSSYLYNNYQFSFDIPASAAVSPLEVFVPLLERYKLARHRRAGGTVKQVDFHYRVRCRGMPRNRRHQTIWVKLGTTTLLSVKRVQVLKRWMRESTSS